MYRVRNVERHRYRKIPRGNSPSVGLITPRDGIRRGAGCRDLEMVALRGVQLGSASPTSAGAHGRPDGSQWRVVQDTRGPVPGWGRQRRCPSPDSGPSWGKIAARRPKTPGWGGGTQRAMGWVKALSLREDHTRPYQSLHTFAVPYYFAPGRAPGRVHGRVTRTYYARRGRNPIEARNARMPVCHTMHMSFKQASYSAAAWTWP